MQEQKISETIIITVEDYDYMSKCVWIVNFLARYAKEHRYLNDDLIRMMLCVKYEPPQEAESEAQ